MAKKIAFSLWGALLAGTSAAAMAQAPQADGNQGGLQDIVVTARKVAENLQDVPVAVTAFTGESLQQQSAIRVPDVARLTPGFNIVPGPSNTALQLQMRGQVQADVLATLDPSVGTYVDGVYWARAYGLNADLLDLQSIQVLRGPQGTLFGRNTTGGALLIQTNDPDFRGVSGLASATYGRFNERSATGVLNMPLIDDKLAARGAFTITKRDGMFTDVVTGRKLSELNSWTGRLKVLAKPTETLSILASAEIFRSNEYVRPYRLRYIGADSVGNLEAGLLLNGIGDPAVRAGEGYAALNDYIANGRRDDVALNEDPHSYAKTQTYNLTATLDTFFGAIKAIGGYRKVQGTSNFDLDGSAVPILSTANGQRLEQWSGELQITGKAMDGRIDFAAGAFAFEESGFDYSTSIVLPNITALSSPVLPKQYYAADVENRSMGMYGQATFKFTDRLSFTGGLRYSVEDKNIVSFNRSVDAATEALLACSIVGADPTTCRIERRDDFDGLSYTAGLNFQVTPDILVYAKTSKGFRSGGQNMRAAGAANAAFVPFRPEIAREEEVGIKTELFNRRVRFNLAAFYNEVSDIQRVSLVTSVDPNTGRAVASTIVSNAGKARFYGGEAELTARLFDGFTLGANAGLVNAKYLTYVDPNTGEDRSREPFQLVPQWTFSLTGTYERELDIGTLTLRADYAWQDRTALYNFYVAPTGNAAQDAINKAIYDAQFRSAGGELNARASLSLMDDRLDLAVFGRNILNRRVARDMVALGAPLSFITEHRNDPVTYGISATFKFGAK